MTLRFRHAVGILTLVCTTLVASAAEAPPASATPPVSVSPGERIGLVLGGGGARGAAHIGVLKVLEREHIPIHAIAGTSIGAVVGALYASGHSPEEIEKLLGSIDWVDLFHDQTDRASAPMRQKETDDGNLMDFEIGVANGKVSYPTALVSGQKLSLLMRSWFLGRSELKSFDDLPIPFRAVATDIGVVQPVVFDSGDLALAVRASMAVPGAFSPVEYNGKVLVDGGIANNLPIDVMRSMGVDRLIIVDVAEPLLPPDQVKTGPAILLQMITGLMLARTEEQLRTVTPQDLLLRPDLGDLGSVDFVTSTKGIDLGEQAALAESEKLRTFAVPEAVYLAWQSTQRKVPEANPVISFIRVVSNSSRTAEYVEDRLSQQVGKPLDREALEKDIGATFGRGTYDLLSYHLVTNEQGQTGLEVVPRDTALGRILFRGGLQISDDFAGRSDYQLNLEARMTDLTSKGGEWRVFGGTGRLTKLETDLYLPFGERGNWFAEPYVGYTAIDQPILFEGNTVAEYRVDSWLGTMDIGRDFGDRFRASAGILRGQDHGERLISLPVLPETLFANLAGINATLLWDSLDNVRFPRTGLRAEASFTSFEEELGSDFDGEQLRLSVDKAFAFGRSTLMIGGRASLTTDEVDSFQTQSALGGLTYLSGLGEYELVGNQMLLFRSVVYRRLSREGLLFDVPVYIAGSVEGGNVWAQRSDVSLDDLIGAASLFLGVDLPIGPLQLGYGRTFDGRDSLYLTFGSLVLPRYR